MRKSIFFVEVQSEYTDDDEENDEDLNKEVDKHVWNEVYIRFILMYHNEVCN